MRKIVFYLLLLISINACKKPGTTNSPAGIDISTGTWRISYFLDQQIKTSNYTGYYFMFLNGGTFMAHGSTNVITGTWSQTDTRIKINFTDPAMTDLNGDWLKTELTTSNIKLKNDSPSQNDELYFDKN